MPSYFCHTFCADTHLAHLPPRSRRGQKSYANTQTKRYAKSKRTNRENQIKISPTALLKTGGQECKMTGQTKYISKDCLTAHWRNIGEVRI